MRVFFEDFEGDVFNGTEMVVYGIVAPVGLFVIMAIAGWLETVLC